MTFHSINIAAVENASFSAHRGGAYGWITPAIEVIALYNASFAARGFHIPRTEQHLIALCLSLMGDKRNDPDHLHAFAKQYSVMTHRTLIEAFCDQPSNAKPIVKLLPKLTGSIWRAPTYRKLDALITDSKARKFLQHRAGISRRDIITLTRLPPTYRTVGVVDLIERKRDLAELMFAIDIVRLVRTDLCDRQIVASLEKADIAFLRDWVMKHYEKTPFPPPPTNALYRGGVEIIRPLTSYADLARAAREFENCIRTYLYGVLKGDTYFYRYAPQAGGDGVAIIELKRIPVAGWVVNEALGPTNDSVGGADRSIIISSFRDVGIGAAPQAIYPNGPWFNLD